MWVETKPRRGRSNRTTRGRGRGKQHAAGARQSDQQGSAFVKPRVHRIYRIAGFCLTGGMVYQAAGCSDNAQAIVVEAVAGLFTSIVNVFISSFVSQLFGVSGFM